MKRQTLALFASSALSLLIACGVPNNYGGGGNGGIGGTNRQGRPNGETCTNHNDCQSLYCATLQGGGGLCAKNPNPTPGGSGGLGLPNTNPGGTNPTPNPSGAKCNQADIDDMLDVCHSSCSANTKTQEEYSACFLSCLDKTLKSPGCSPCVGQFYGCVNKNKCSGTLSASGSCCGQEYAACFGNLKLEVSHDQRKYCTEGSACSSGVCMMAASRSGYCSKKCASDQDCKLGMKCAYYAAMSQNVCLQPNSCGRAEIDTLLKCLQPCGSDQNCQGACFQSLSSTCTQCMTTWAQCAKAQSCDGNQKGCCDNERYRCSGE